MEFTWLDVLLDYEASRSFIRQACASPGLRRRQVFRLLAAIRENSAASRSYAWEG
jgi:hypothetical protein